MLKLKENIECYSSPSQRDVLIRIIDNETIKNNLFLTGGTALSVFYLHHRTSIDLDLFTIKKVPLDEIYLWITKTWPNECQRINQNEYILQMIIKDIKVDVVQDPLSFDESREKYYFDENKSLTIDSIRNIAAGKFTTLVSRREVKDFLPLPTSCGFLTYHQCRHRRQNKKSFPGLTWKALPLLLPHNHEANHSVYSKQE